MFFLKRSNVQRYPDLMDFLSTSDMVGNDNYPKTIVEVYNLLLQYSTTRSSQNSNSNNRNRRGGNSRQGGTGNQPPGVSFYQQRPGDMPEPDRSNPVAGTDGNIAERQCYRCYAWGHFADKCPNARNVQALQVGISLTQTNNCESTSNTFISRSWILLDTCSTNSVVSNPNLVSNIRQCNENETLRINTNGGTKVYNQIGDLNLLPLRVHVNETSLANILSLKDVANVSGAKVTMDTSQSRSIQVLLKNNTSITFLEAHNGLYYMDTSDPMKHINVPINGYSFLSTVKSNKTSFTTQQIKGADRACSLQAILGWPSTTDFKSAVASNFIKNSPVTINDIDRAEFIYGPALPTLQGKMTRKQPVSKPTTFIPVPSIIKQHYNIDLYIDFFFVNRIPFLHTKSKNINFLSVQPCTSRKASIIAGLKTVKSK